MTEDTHQILLMTWARKMAIAGRGELNLLFHVPNGGGRSKGEGAKLKALGVKAGVSDLFLPVIVGGVGGLWVEMKTDGGVVSAEQEAWLLNMEAQGYATAVCYGWGSAVEVIKEYLDPVYGHRDWPEIDMSACVGRVS